MRALGTSVAAMALLAFAANAPLETAAAADPLVALTARHATVPEGGDHADWNGVELAIERSPLARTSLRLELALDHIVGTSDEPAYRYDGNQISGLGGVRLALSSPASRLRVYYAAGIGVGWRTVDTPRSSLASNLYVEPVRLGVELDIAGPAALRIDSALIVRPTDYDPLALTIGAGLAFRL